jgi:2-oxoisovalerate dehydrogenase E1 component
VVFIEPIARYMTRDLMEEGDGQWTYHYPPPHTEQQIRLGELHQEGRGTELCLLSYGNGYYLCRQVAERLKDQHGIQLRLIDLRWLAPLDETALLAAIAPCSHLLIVDECRRSGSISEALVTLIIEKAATIPRLKRITSEDCFIPLGPAYAATLPSKAQILEAALLLLGK